MAEPLNLGAGRWVRFSRYEVAGGYIRPAEGAELIQYDPWELYPASDRDPAPYVTLINLVSEVPTAEDEHGRVWVEPEGKAPLERWCAEFGLLGVLPHRALSVSLAPRWRRQSTGNLFPTQQRFFRTSTEWQERLYADYPAGSKPKKVKDGDLVATNNVPSRFLPTGVVFQDIQTLQTQFERLNETLGRYFPTISEDERATYEYPLPYESDEFWQLYAEPVDEFLRAAWMLRNALEWLGQWKAIASDAKLARQGMDLINSLVAGVSVIALPSPEGPIRQRWVSPSLLGSLAMMALQDLTELRRVLPCANCRRLFATESYQRKFCSDRCRNTAQKQRWRAKKKEA